MSLLRCFFRLIRYLLNKDYNAEDIEIIDNDWCDLEIVKVDDCLKIRECFITRKLLS